MQGKFLVQESYARRGFLVATLLWNFDKKKINKRREKGTARGAHLPGTLMEKQRKRVLCLDVRVDGDGLLILRKILIREKEKMKRNRPWSSIRANKFCSDIYVANNWFFKIP